MKLKIEAIKFDFLIKSDFFKNFKVSNFNYLNCNFNRD